MIEARGLFPLLCRIFLHIPLPSAPWAGCLHISFWSGLKEMDLPKQSVPPPPNLILSPDPRRRSPVFLWPTFFAMLVHPPLPPARLFPLSAA